MTRFQSFSKISAKSLKKDISRSFWLYDSPENPEADPRRQAHRCDVAIIGGGFTGLSTAFHMRTLLPGSDVRVLETKMCGYGASGRNSGYLSTVFGMGKAATASKYGKQHAIAGHHYMRERIGATSGSFQRPIT